MISHSKVCPGRKWLRVLSDFVSSVKYLEVKRAAEDRERWRAVNRRLLQCIAEY